MNYEKEMPRRIENKNGKKKESAKMISAKKMTPRTKKIRQKQGDGTEKIKRNKKWYER